jgi:alpha-ketoglutarate-dependent 2,4-dichlorophenoxyacetate dioxygenase
LPLEIIPLHPAFGAEIRGVDVGRSLDAATVAAVRDAINSYAIVLFRDQVLNDETHMRFARSFGELEVSLNAIRKGNRPDGISAVISDITNLDADNNVRGLDDRRRLFALGNRLWHTDSSFRRVPAALSMFYARQIPPSDGETEFADMRAGYDSLPADLKARLHDMVAVHDYTTARRQMGFDDFSAEEHAAWPPVKHRLVRRHAESGRASIYLGSHASHIEGMPVPEGRVLLRDLTERVTQREFVYVHNWKVRDLIIWDNRCTLHRGREWDPRYPRDFRRCTTSDVAYAEGALA